MENNSSMLERLFTFLMLLSVVSAVSNIIFYIFSLKNMYIFISMISLFIVGVSVLVIYFKYDNKENVLDKYVVLDKEEYEVMKNTLYKQERELKKLKATIKNKEL